MLKLKRNAIVLLSVILSLSLFGSAHAAPPVLQVTVGGTTYDITMTAGSFNSVNGGVRGTNGVLENQPWWTSDGNSASAAGLAAEQIAEDFRDAWYTAAISHGSALTSNESYLFGYAVNINGSNINAEAVRWRTNQHVSPDGAVPTPTETSNSGGTLYWATAAAVAVPEIDGPMAAQAAFVLSASLLWLRGRRRQKGALS